MLTCKDVAERVTGYLERDLSWSEWMQFRLHVVMCALCRRYVSQMRATRSILQRLGHPLGDDPSIDEGLRAAFRSWRDESRRS